MQFVKSEQELDAFSLFLSVVAEPMWSEQPWGFGNWPRGQVTQHCISCPSRQFLSAAHIYARTENSYLLIRKRYILKVFVIFTLGQQRKLRELGKGTKPDSPILKPNFSSYYRKICGKGNCYLLSSFRVESEHLSFLSLHSH